MRAPRPQGEAQPKGKAKASPKKTPKKVSFTAQNNKTEVLYPLTEGEKLCHMFDEESATAEVKSLSLRSLCFQEDSAADRLIRCKTCMKLQRTMVITRGRVK